MRRPLAASLALGTTLAATLGHAALAQGEPADPDHPVWKIVQPNESVGGQTYEAWARDYTEWLLWDRTPENPPPDATGDCEGGQPGGDVFFVPHTMIGTASEYACSVGADVARGPRTGGQTRGSPLRRCRVHSCIWRWNSCCAASALSAAASAGDGT